MDSPAAASHAAITTTSNGREWGRPLFWSAPLVNQKAVTNTPEPESKLGIMLVADLRQAFRSLRRRPAFALAAILTIALGVGANTAVYQVIYAVLLRRLPFHEPQRLMQIWESTPMLPQLQIAVPDFEDWRSQTHSFAQLAAYTFQAMNRITLLGQGEPEVVQATSATAGLFPAMGIRPVLGRTFSDADEREKRPVALISEKLWRAKFGADPAVVGRAVRLETESFTVIGVVPTRQAFPAWADVWMPFSWVEPELRGTRKYHPLEVIARLRPGVSEAAADQEMRTLAARLAVEHRDTNGTVAAYAIPLAQEITGDVRPALLLVWAAVGLVLLMACANLGHMLLARMLDRRQEMAIRASLGAGRGRLVRLVFTESLLLAAAGGGCGALLAMAATGVLERMAQGRIPRLEGLGAGGQKPLFVLALSLACGILFTLPACAQALRAESRPATGRSMSKPRSPLGSVLIAAEVAMAFIVLMGAALLVRSFAGLLSEDPGFRASGVLAVEVPLPSGRYDWEKAAQFLKAQLLPAVRALPGVEDVAAANCAPMSLGPTEHTRYATRFGIEGRTFESGRYPVAQFRWVTPEYFRVLNIPLKRGRWLTEADRDQPRYMINETLARRFFPDTDPTTHRLVMGVMDSQTTLTTIAGVAGDVRDMGLDEASPPTLYLISSSPRMTLLVKTAGEPMRLAGAIREAIHRADPEVAVLKVATVEQYVADSLARRRFALNLLAAFAGLAALLTAAGIYGLLAYSVSGRVREFGIRAALGATPASLLRLVLREGAAVTIPGLAAGLAISLAGARLVKGMLYRLSPMDPVSLVAVGAVLAVITVLSVWLPARRAAAVDPGAALRVE
jgi:putative ABC transport system permease protein